MKVNNEKTENRQAFLTIEMEPTEVEDSLKKSYQRLVRSTRIPGFRKGKAPRAILENYIGKESLFEDTLKYLLPEAYDNAIKEQEIEAIAQPQLEVTQTEPLVFKAVVPLKPEVKLGDYREIQVTAEPVGVTENHIDGVIEQLRHQYATWEPTDRAVDFGDMVIINIDSTVDGNPYIMQDGAQYQVVPEVVLPAPGFSEQLVGMKSDQEKKFNIAFPADHPRADLAEKEAAFTVCVTEIKEEVLPELTDDFARIVDPEFDNLAALREKVNSQLKVQAAENTRVDYEDRVIEAVVDISEVEFPPILEEAEIHRILDQRFQKGNQEIEEYLRYANQTEEELHEEVRPVAHKRVVRSLLLGKIVDEEEIEVSDDEIDIEIVKMISSSTDKRDELEKILNIPQNRESIRQTLITRQSIHRLVEIAGGLPDNQDETTEEEK